MRAVVQHGYGGWNVLEFRADVPNPHPRAGEVAIEVVASSVNPADRFRVTGRPWVGRLAFGLFRPRVPVPGIDVAGVVVAVGSGVHRFAVGDEVYGQTMGAYGERVRAREDRIALRPRSIAIDEAAALPVAGVTALQALRDVAKVGPGHRVLINGASGGVGSFAVQIARARGAEVTAVCSARNEEMVRNLGAAHVVDYATRDFTRRRAAYDAILDLVGSAPLGRCLDALTPRGVYVAAVGRTSWIVGAGLRSLISRRVKVLAASTRTADLDALRELVDAGVVRPVIDRRFDLEHVGEALRYSSTNRVRGKCLVMVGTAG